MDKQDFINKYARNIQQAGTSVFDIRKVMMVDLNLVINQILKEKEESDFLNKDCE